MDSTRETDSMQSGVSVSDKRKSVKIEGGYYVMPTTENRQSVKIDTIDVYNTLPSLKRQSVKQEHKAMIAELEKEVVQDLHPGTNLNLEAWESIEDPLLSFEITTVLICLCAFALIGVTIYVFENDKLVPELGIVYLQAVNVHGLWIFVLILPALIGIFQIILAISFSFLAILEKWEQLSILDVVLTNTPEKLKPYVRKLPLNCTARRSYVFWMYVWIIFQFIAIGTFLGLVDTAIRAANSGKNGSSEIPIIKPVLDFSASVFNECCAERGWSKQGFIQGCIPNTEIVANCTLNSTTLCACISGYDAGRELANQQYVNSSGLCGILSRASIPVKTGDKIPGAGISIRVLIPEPIESVPLVGHPNITYGCGTGYYRGFQYSLATWLLITIRPILVVTLIITGLQMFFLMIGSTVVCAKHRTAKYDDDGNFLGVKPSDSHAKLAVTQRKFGLRALFSKNKNLSPYSKYIFTSPRLAFMSPKPRSMSEENMRRAARPSVKALNLNGVNNNNTNARVHFAEEHTGSHHNNNNNNQIISAYAVQEAGLRSPPI